MHGFGAALHAAVIGLLLALPVVAPAQETAGSYWVDIVREDSAYVIVLGIEVKEPVTVRAARVPTFVDASSLPLQRDVLPLFNTEVRFPIKFGAEGRGRFYIEILSAGQEKRRSYIVFELFSGADAGDARRELDGYSGLWRSVGADVELKFGGAAIACDNSLTSEVDRLGLLSGGAKTSGVMLAGTAEGLGEDLAGLSAAGWGLRYLAAKTDTDVGCFVGGERKQQQATTTKPKPTRQTTQQPETKPTTQQPREEQKPEPKPDPEPQSGPWSGASAAKAIEPWASAQQGRFAETAIEMPAPYSRLKRVDKAELVLTITHMDSGYASGRVFIHSSSGVEQTQSSGGFWFGDKRGGQEEFLSDFQAGREGEELRFDVGYYLRQNPGTVYYVIIENLARGSRIKVDGIRIEVSGEL